MGDGGTNAGGNVGLGGSIESRAARSQEIVLREVSGLSRSDGLPSATWDDIINARERQAERDARRKIRIEAVDGKLKVTPIEPVDPTQSDL